MPGHITLLIQVVGVTIDFCCYLNYMQKGICPLIHSFSNFNVVLTVYKALDKLWNNTKMNMKFIHFMYVY